MRAVCSCADPASKLGKCKHSVGLLLWCKEEKNVSSFLPIPLFIYLPKTFEAVFSSNFKGRSSGLKNSAFSLRSTFEVLENVSIV